MELATQVGRFKRIAFLDLGGTSEFPGRVPPLEQQRIQESTERDLSATIDTSARHHKKIESDGFAAVQNPHRTKTCRCRNSSYHCYSYAHCQDYRHPSFSHRAPPV
jgi:hypothetical protein